ncbi:hypothetical protein L3Q82_000601 [Scortum barcoo]|uniref:Uncharacterized protein n=1 Tax=Scortum barcoo TaxID=214431 RepID=A0ACB8WF56_9TELE|nr:hypothetical protein L3Q82_000601 [Scortum barcoo]
MILLSALLFLLWGEHAGGFTFNGDLRHLAVAANRVYISTEERLYQLNHDLTLVQSLTQRGLLTAAERVEDQRFHRVSETDDGNATFRVNILLPFVQNQSLVSCGVIDNHCGYCEVLDLNNISNVRYREQIQVGAPFNSNKTVSFLVDVKKTEKTETYILTGGACTCVKVQHILHTLTVQDCWSAQDPYCVWCSSKKSCTFEDDCKDSDWVAIPDDSRQQKMISYKVVMDSPGQITLNIQTHVTAGQQALSNFACEFSATSSNPCSRQSPPQFPQCTCTLSDSRLSAEVKDSQSGFFVRASVRYRHLSTPFEKGALRFYARLPQRGGGQQRFYAFHCQLCNKMILLSALLFLLWGEHAGGFTFNGDLRHLAVAANTVYISTEERLYQLNHDLTPVQSLTQRGLLTAAERVEDQHFHRVSETDDGNATFRVNILLPFVQNQSLVSCGVIDNHCGYCEVLDLNNISNVRYREQIQVGAPFNSNKTVSFLVDVKRETEKTEKTETYILTGSRLLASSVVPGGPPVLWSGVFSVDGGQTNTVLLLFDISPDLTGEADQDPDFCFKCPVKKEPKTLKPQTVLFRQDYMSSVLAVRQKAWMVFFIGTADGQLIKLAVDKNFHTACPRVLYRANDDRKVFPKIHLDQVDHKHVYLPFRNQVERVPVSKCSTYTTVQDCWSAQDPYCVWCSSKKSCTFEDDCKDSDWVAIPDDSRQQKMISYKVVMDSPGQITLNIQTHVTAGQQALSNFACEFSATSSKPCSRESPPQFPQCTCTLSDSRLSAEGVNSVSWLDVAGVKTAVPGRIVEWRMQRQAGEPPRVLASDIETLARRAYAYMPTKVQSELARDQFIRAITPRELCIQTQLAHLSTLQEALELALEREVVGGTAESNHTGSGPVLRTVVQESPGQEKPAWAAELTELIHAVSDTCWRFLPCPHHPGGGPMHSL